jgi:hypothetical protein
MTKHSEFRNLFSSLGCSVYCVVLCIVLFCVLFVCIVFVPHLKIQKKKLRHKHSTEL